MARVACSPIARAVAANLVVTTLAILINNHQGASSATLTSSMATIAVEATATLGGEPDGMVHKSGNQIGDLALACPVEGARCNQHRPWHRWVAAV